MAHLEEAKPLMQKTLDRLQEELSVIRTGRASPALVENIQVEAYGTFQPVKALASLSTPDNKTLHIDPWDSSVTKAIESAIQASDIGINPVVDGKTIRLTMPQMTEETRQKMVKLMKEKLEEARVAIRKIREDIRKKIGAQTGISEDIIKKDQEALDKIVKDLVAKVEELGAKKEEEIMKI